jgi:hypothetical protein
MQKQRGQILNERVIWRTKNGSLVHLLLSYVQSVYHGGHVSFLGSKPQSEETGTAHLRLELDAERMSEDERKLAGQALRRALGLLEKPAASGTAD